MEIVADHHEAGRTTTLRARGRAPATADHGGDLEEYRAWARPWGFAPESVTGPVRIWQGDADTLVPPRWGQELARRIPGAKLDLLSGEGHFLGYRHQADILGDLIDDLAGRPD